MATAFQVAAELAAAAQIRDDAQMAARKAGQAIVDQWMSEIPSSPGGYEGAGFSSSPGANKMRAWSDPAGIGVEVYNQSFVVGILQAGNSSNGPRLDLLGSAEPHIDQWLDDLQDEVGL